MRLGEGESPVEATRISTPQADITTYSSDPEVAPGYRFALGLEVEPGPGMHVYAPGANGYQVIALTIDPTLGDPAINPQAANNEKLMAVRMLLYKEQGTLGVPLVTVPNGEIDGGK